MCWGRGREFDTFLALWLMLDDEVNAHGVNVWNHQYLCDVLTYDVDLNRATNSPEHRFTIAILDFAPETGCMLQSV